MKEEEEDVEDGGVLRRYLRDLWTRAGRGLAVRGEVTGKFKLFFKVANTAYLC